MKNHKIILKYTLVLIYCLTFSLGYSQDPDPLDPGSDPGQSAAPIDQWIIPVMLIITTLIFFYLKKQNNQKTI